MNDFDDLTDLDEVFGPLRSAATPAELAQDATMVERMVNAHRTAEGKHMFTSRRARVATLVAAGVLGFGGMAAASPNLLAETTFVQQDENDEIEEIDEIDEVEEVDDGLIEDDDDQVEDVEPTEQEPADDVDPQPEPVVVEVDSADDIEDVPVEPADALRDDDLTTESFNEEHCLPGNHGATVSAVARDDLPEDFPEGVTVTDAAHSSCGKDIEDSGPDTAIDDEVDAETEVDAEVDDEVDDDAETEVEIESEPKPERQGGSDKGAGSNGNGNGNGNGRGGRGG